MSWSIGDRVTHPARPDWGLGEIVRVGNDNKLVVYFERAGEKLLKGAPIVPASGSDAERNVLRSRTRVAPRPRGAAQRSVEQYKQAFIDLFPLGFRDREYVRRERDYKVSASRQLNRSLAKEPFAALLARGRYTEACKAALSVVSATNLVYPNEKMDLRDGLRVLAAEKRFSEDLFMLLHGDRQSERAFESFVNTLAAIGAAKWTIATYFGFLKSPRQEMFLKPVPTRRIAAACGVELNYRSDPNWLTYESVRSLARQLTHTLEDLGPRDMIDVQSFIWCVAR